MTVSDVGMLLQRPEGLSALVGVPLALILLAGFAPRTVEKAFRKVARPFARLAGRKRLVVWLLFFTVIGVRLAVFPLLRVPIPGIHDEFSYLLMGDTFAHGRLANPTHPMWMSFESFHVNWFPTYSSKYPPGQGVVLALGQFLGLPWIGVMLSTGAMCAAILWMLQAWLPPKWALLGGISVALKFGIASYWMNSYWGGAVAASGGALVLGAMPRIIRHARTRDALLLGLGLATLANTRPYEGLLFSIPVTGWFFWWLLGKAKSAPPLQTRIRSVLLPAAGVLLMTVAFMGYYNWRLTGNPLLSPYVLNERAYNTMGLFLWDRPKPPLEYRNDQFEDFYNQWEREEYQNTRAGVWKVSAQKLNRNGSVYFWWGAVLLLPGARLLYRDKRMRFLLILFFLEAAGVFVVIWSMPHYAAPVACVIFALTVQAIRHLNKMRVAGRPIGMALAAAAVMLLGVDTTRNVSRRVCDPLRWTCEGDPSRVAIQEKLSHTPGKHLIIVRYGEEHNIHDEWVFNGAEIDSAKVLWARELDAEQNAKLFAYFKDRRIWLVAPDEDNTELIPYPRKDLSSEP